MILNARQIQSRFLKVDESSNVFPPVILLAIEDVTEMMVIAESLAGHTKHLEAKRREEDNRNRQEADRRVDVDRELLGAGQPLAHRENEGDHDRHDGRQVTDIGRSGDGEEADRDLDVPGDLGEEPGDGADRSTS